MKRVILHADMNSCYASIECLHRPDIRHLPVAVAGDVESRHGIILAKNEHAKKFKIATGDAIWQARQKCPNLVIVPPRYDLYLRFSRLARQIYGEYSNQIEPFGLDEAWLDITGSVHLFGDGETVAHIIRERVKRELGITVSIGVSYNKIFAKLGSDYKKPDAVTVFTPENYREKVWPLPVEDLLYVGAATTKKLGRYGIRTIGQLAQMNPDSLHYLLGAWGYILHSFANGLDTTPVSVTGEESVIKSIGNSTTAPRDLTCPQDISILFYVLAESVSERMHESGFLARGVQITLRDTKLYSFQRQKKLSAPTALASSLHDAGMELLAQNYNWTYPIRSVGLRAMDFVPITSPQQLTIFDSAERIQKREQLEETMAELRQRFGHFAVARAVTLTDPALGTINPKDDHIIHPVSYFNSR